MQLNELEHETSSEVTPTLRTGYCSRNLLFHSDSTSGTKPVSTYLERQCFPWLFGLRYKTGVQLTSQIARELHIAAQAREGPPTLL
jgi:hypothetical protein